MCAPGSRHELFCGDDERLTPAFWSDNQVLAAKISHACDDAHRRLKNYAFVEDSVKDLPKAGVLGSSPVVQKHHLHFLRPGIKIKLSVGSSVAYKKGSVVLVIHELMLSQ